MNTRRASVIAATGLAALLWSALLLAGPASAQTPHGLEQAFLNPPDAARPWVYWFWLNGNITPEGITADLEAMKRVGIGGVLIMEVEQGASPGPIAFMGPQWRELFKHVVAEAQRLGLEVNINDGPGWNGSGGPWIKPEQAMQKVVFSETDVEGPRRFDAVLSQPQAVEDFYRDIAVLAFPTPGAYRIDDIITKAGYKKGTIAPASQPSLSSEMVIARDRIVDLSDKMDDKGRLVWDAPPGKWTVMRFGHTCTGAKTKPPPVTGRGLECDKLSREGTDANFAGMMEKLIADVGPAAGKTLVATHVDSWENGAQNWTTLMREEFRKRRGYDMLPFLPVMTGRVVGTLDTSERFLWDLRQTISDLILDNYAGRMRDLAREHGMRFSLEGYGEPGDDIPYAGRADEPMCEFWIGGHKMETCKEMASSVHLYGKPILGAEAFTARDTERWLEHPATIKALGDEAFCDGVTRFVFHRYAMQPWLDRAPGMTMGPWGLHYERTNTWWEQSAAWHQYLSRCQLMLRQGLFVADVCYVQPEITPQGYIAHERPGYDFDHCTAEAVLTRMGVKDGRIALPDGLSYRLLVLPKVATMTPQLLRKITELVEAGATILGPRPSRSPSLSDAPRSDAEVKTLTDRLWGDDKPATGITERSYGKGRVFSESHAANKTNESQGAQAPLGQAKWIWHNEGKGKPTAVAPATRRYFRRTLTLEPGLGIESALLVMTADNSYEAWVNGRRAIGGDSHTRLYSVDVAPLLKTGVNVLAVTAENGGTKPNAAGLIGQLTIRFRDGRTIHLGTDREWASVAKAKDDWTTATTPLNGWKPVLELGPPGMTPWPNVGKPVPLANAFPNARTVCDVLGRMDVRRDFEADGNLRYIHRRDGGTDIYFVANGENNWIGTNGTFRVSGKVPEIWDPLTGKTRRQAIYREVDGRTTLPICLEPSGSLFIVFRGPEATADATSKADPIIVVSRNGQGILPEAGHPQTTPPPAELLPDQAGDMNLLAWQPGRYEVKTLAGKIAAVEVEGPLAAQDVTGSWDVSFEPKRGAPAKVVFDHLVDWSKHADPGVKYFSGTANYSKTIHVSPDLLTKDRRLYLDLGKVQVMAEVTLNDKPLGTLWRSPYRVDITDVVRPGDNTLLIRVVNLWPNRMIGDEQLPEDSDRNSNGTLKGWPQWLQEGKPSPTGRYTFTSWRLWKKDAPLLESGLLGPVAIRPVAVVRLKP